jgi:hypothetical protein
MFCPLLFLFVVGLGFELGRHYFAHLKKLGYWSEY